MVHEKIASKPHLPEGKEETWSPGWEELLWVLLTDQLLLNAKQPGAGREASPEELGKEGTIERRKNQCPYPPSSSEDWVINEGGIHWDRVEAQGLEQLSWNFLIHFPLTTSPKNSDVNWNPKISESSEPSHGWVTSCLTCHCTNDPEEMVWCGSFTVI